MGLIKSIWNGFGDVYEDMHSSHDNYEDSSHYNRSSDNRRVVTSGWAGGYSDFVGGPIKIVQHRENSEIQCFRPGMVYSGAQHSEYTYQAHAISAYWSGDVLYAQLDNGNICEWNSPGCPFEH